MKTELKRVFIPCTELEYHDIVKPTLLANGCLPDVEVSKWEKWCTGVTVFSSQTYITSVVATNGHHFQALTVTDLQAQYPISACTNCGCPEPERRHDHLWCGACHNEMNL